MLMFRKRNTRIRTEQGNRPSSERKVDGDAFMQIVGSSITVC